MNSNRVIEALNATENMRNFTVLSDKSVSLPTLGINIERDGERYIVTEYARDHETGEYGVFGQEVYGIVGLREWIDEVDDALSV